MIDFNPLRQKQVTMATLSAPLSVEDLRRLTHEMLDRMLEAIADSVDADVIFEPHDPQADDAGADNEADRRRGWTLAHVIAHTTASAEESAVLAAEMARGVPLHGRSRYEVPWESITTVVQCRQRLAESRRLRVASLDLWPDLPHLEIEADYPYLTGPFDARGRFLIGLWHDDGHLGQLGEIMRQASQARQASQRRGQ